MLPRGLICPLLTPLKSTGEVDAVGLKQLWEYVAPYAVAISLGSSFSLEGVYLNYEQKQALFKLISGIWDGNPVLFLNITGENEACTLHLAQLATSLFESALDKVRIEVLPLWYRGNRGLPQHLDKLYTQTQTEIVLANHPSIIKKKKNILKHTYIRTSVFKKIAQRQFIKGMIFQGGLSQFFNYQRALHNRTEFLFYEGDEAAFLNQPASDGVVALTANLVPEMWAKLVAEILNPKGDSGNTNLQEIFSLGLKLRRLYDIGSLSPRVLKWALAEIGVLPEIYSPYPESLNENTLLKVKQWLKDLMN